MIIKKLLPSLAAILLLAPLGFAQPEMSTASVQMDPPTKHLGPGQKIEDSKGRTVTNNGTNTNGSVHVSYTGKLSENPKGSGCFETTGEITNVTNPASQGSNGPIVIDTTGDPLVVDLNKTGSSTGSPIPTTISGGNATVTINGNNNNVTVGGTGNTVNMNGTGNTGDGADPNSGGTVNMGGRGNSWGGTGNWNVRN